MSTDSRRIMGAETALAVLLRGIADDAGMWSDVTAHATVDADPGPMTKPTGHANGYTKAARP